MSHTYTSVNIHLVFSTKNREQLIVGELKERLWPFLGGVARRNRIDVRTVGGVADHVHLLITMPTTLSIARAVQLIKGRSSTWIHETFPKAGRFARQEGYGAFSVSKSHIAATTTYIKNQEKHHRNKSFKDEYIAFLKKHEIDYDEKYLWD